ncbi:hypothetical protein CBL_07349 [Carabus blaptoides fortunei]
MSSALLRKSLALCDPDLEQSNNLKSKRNNKEKKLKARVTKLDKKQVITSNKKVSVTEAREKLKTKERILQENLARIKLLKKKCAVKLDKDIADKVIERALTRKPIAPKIEKKPEESTVFTEEDFKKFEEEYVDY